jgi:hypothetical protein
MQSSCPGSRDLNRSGKGLRQEVLSCAYDLEGWISMLNRILYSILSSKNEAHYAVSEAKYLILTHNRETAVV